MTQPTLDCFSDKPGDDNTPYRQCGLRLMERVPGEEQKFRPVTPETRRACWLPSAGLEEGMLISLKGETDIYHVEGISPVQKPRYLLHTDWNVGGLEARPTKKGKKR
jgi:hypothetical protein